MSGSRFSKYDPPQKNGTANGKHPNRPDWIIDPLKHDPPHNPGQATDPTGSRLKQPMIHKAHDPARNQAQHGKQGGSWRLDHPYTNTLRGTTTEMIHPTRSTGGTRLCSSRDTTGRAVLHAVPSVCPLLPPTQLSASPHEVVLPGTKRPRPKPDEPIAAPMTWIGAKRHG